VLPTSRTSITIGHIFFFFRNGSAFLDKDLIGLAFLDKDQIDSLSERCSDRCSGTANLVRMMG